MGAWSRVDGVATWVENLVLSSSCQYWFLTFPPIYLLREFFLWPNQSFLLSFLSHRPSTIIHQEWILLRKLTGCFFWFFLLNIDALNHGLFSLVIGHGRNICHWHLIQLIPLIRIKNRTSLGQSRCRCRRWQLFLLSFLNRGQSQLEHPACFCLNQRRDRICFCSHHRRL